MYYEARIYETQNVADANEAARIIKAGGSSCAAYTWPITGTSDKCIVVGDGHIDNPFLEVAVILEKADGSRSQIESITADWVDSELHLAQLFESAIASPCDMGSAQLNLGQAAPDATATFECGCCGTGFKGNIAEQLKFDQDAGFGICPKCTKYYS